MESPLCQPRHKGDSRSEIKLWGEEDYAIVIDSSKYTFWMAWSSSTPSAIGFWNDLRPQISPMPPARLLTTAVVTASFKSELP